VATTLVADLETPVSAFLKLTAARAANVFLLESVEGGAARGRYSMIGLDPDIVWRATGEVCEINRTALHAADAFERQDEKPLDALRALIAESRIDADPSLPPMAAGVFGYLGYDMVRQMERLPAPKPDPIGVPDAVMIRPTLMVVFDSVRDELSIVTPVRPQAGVDARAAWEAAQARLDAVVAVLESPPRPHAAGGRSASARRPAALQHAGSALPRHGRAGEGLHPRRRHLPGRAVAALRMLPSAAHRSRCTARCGG
jgi:anthranilate synthase component I